VVCCGAAVRATARSVGRVGVDGGLMIDPLPKKKNSRDWFIKVSGCF